MPAGALEIARGQRPALTIEHATRKSVHAIGPRGVMILILWAYVCGVFSGVLLTTSEPAARGVRRIQPVTAAPMAAPPAGSGGRLAERTGRELTR